MTNLLSILTTYFQGSPSDHSKNKNYSHGKMWQLLKFKKLTANFR